MCQTPHFRLVLWLLLISQSVVALAAEVTLGEAPLAPTSLAGLPGGGPRPLVVNGGFTVDTTSREQVREFYNAVYQSSAGIPINTTAVVASCIPGTNAPAFGNATLRRINWFRALAGLPAAVTFNAAENTKDQAGALMMAAQGALQHTGNWTGWACLSSDGTNAAANSNIALGNYGPDAITAYIWDFGAGNYELGHRRWLLYPQTQIMASGDVPAQGGFNSANNNWVFDANYGGPRPATRTSYVPWPPPGYVPYQVVFPQWSFALTNAGFTNATITMTSNGVPVAVTKQTYVVGYGENTLVWYPTGLDPTGQGTFPFGGTDTVYGITISNVVTTVGTKNFSYNVTVFDPAVAGPDYSPLVISGTNQPAINVGNAYSCTPSTNPYVTGYQWLSAQATNGNLVDGAMNGLTNFTFSPAPNYPVITNSPDGATNCFHLTHSNTASQFLQLKELVLATNNTTLSFKSRLGYATTNQVARVQITTDNGASWQNLYSQAGTGGSGETSFTLRSFSLAAYTGKSVLLRFDYEFNNGSYYPQADIIFGWTLESVTVTNAQQLVNLTTNATSSTNFTFTPTATGNYILQAQGVIFSEFPTDLGTVKQVTAIVGPPVMTLKSPLIVSNQVKINFTLQSGAAASYHLLQANQVNGPWTTNGTAILTTNVPGSSFQFVTTNGSVTRFYRVQAP